jgi:hypothetical protein
VKNMSLYLMQELSLNGIACQSSGGKSFVEIESTSILDHRSPSPGLLWFREDYAFSTQPLKDSPKLLPTVDTNSSLL